LRTDNPKFNGPTDLWLELCLQALAERELELALSEVRNLESEEANVALFIRSVLKR
jgi:hypothetical protein